MTIQDNGTRNQYTAAALQTVFAYTFEIFIKNDIAVEQNGILLSEGTDYTVSNVGNDSGGDITLLTGASSGDIITIYRDMAFERLTDYQQSGDFLSDEVNDDFDRLWAVNQQINTSLSLAIRSAIDDSVLTPVNTIIPDVATRKSKVIGFDVNGLIEYKASAFSVAISGAKYYDTSSQATADIGLVVGDIAIIKSRANGIFHVISGTGTANTFNNLAHDTLSLTLELSLDGPVHVKSCGAVGDGANDDTAAIQAALDASSKVISDAGLNHKISFSLLINTDQHFDGQGCIFTMAFGNAGCAMISASYATSNTPIEDVLLENFTLNGVLSGNGENGIGLTQAHRWLLSKIVFNNIDLHAVDMGGAKDCSIRDCQAFNLASTAYQFDSLGASGTVFALDTDGSTSIANAFDAGNPDWTVTSYCLIDSCRAEDCFIGVQYHRGSLSHCDVVNSVFFECEKGIGGDDAVTADLIKILNNSFVNCGVGIVGGWAIILAIDFSSLIISGNTIKGPTNGNTSAIFAGGINLFKNTSDTPSEFIISNNTIRTVMQGIDVDTYTDGVISGNALFDVSNKAPGASIGSCAIELTDCQNVIVSANKLNSCLDCGVRVIDNVGSSVNVSVLGNLFRSVRNSIVMDGADNYIVSENNIGSFNWAGSQILINNCVRGKVNGNFISASTLNIACINMVGTLRSSIIGNDLNTTNIGIPILIDSSGAGGNEIATANNNPGFVPPTPTLRANNGSFVKSLEPMISAAKSSSDGTSTLSHATLTFASL